MKNVFKKYWWILFLIILTPCVINYFMIKPRICEITGNDTSWLSFWGGYIGSIISSSIAVFILCKQLQQNHNENKDNRKLQLAIVKHEQEKARLSQLKKALTDFILSCNDNEIDKVVGNMMSNNYTLNDYNSLRNLWDDIDEKRLIIELNIKKIPKTIFLDNYILASNASYNSYVFKIKNLAYFHIIMTPLPENKKKRHTYVEDLLDNIGKIDFNNSEKTDASNLPKSIVSIIKENGNYDKIDDYAPLLIGSFISQFGTEIKPKLTSTIIDLVQSEEKRIDDELYNIS